MSDATRSQLEQAYRLIQQEDLDKAIAILKPIVSAQPNNIDAWWLLSNAVSEPADARNALQNVLRLDPNHPQARGLLDDLNQQFPEYSSPSFSSPAPRQSAPPVPQQSFSEGEDVSSDDLDKLLGERYPSNATPPSDNPFPAEEENFDTLFSQAPDDTGDNPFDDPFASKDPGFVKGTDIKKKQPREKKVKAPKPERPEKGLLDPLEIERRANSRTSPALLIGIILIIVIVIGGGVTLAFMTGLIGGPRGGQTATAVAANVSPSPAAIVPPPATATATTAPATVEAVPLAETSAATSAAAIAEVPTAIETAAATSSTGGAIDSASKALADSFTAAKFNNAQATVVQSSLGDTLQVQFCSSAGPSLQTNLNKAMDLIAPQAATIKDSIKAAGVLIVNCAKPDTTLVHDIAPIDAIVTYVGGNLADKKTYRASWIKS